MKRINKILWHGVDIPIPSAYEGSLDGLNCGELYIYENDEDPAIFIKTNKNKVKRIGGGGGGTTDINEILDLIDQKLNGYATEEWVSSTYATKTALSTLSSSVNSLRIDFDNLNALLNDDVTGKINTWYEVVDFLDEYSGSQDLAAILSGMNTDIASRVEKSKFSDYFATEMAKWFVKDDANKGIKPVNSYGLYSDTYVSAKGVSTGTGGSGGGSSYNRLDKWSDYSSDKAGWVLSALLGQDLNTRLTSLESGSALSLVTTGDGNAVTAIAKSGNQLTVTKGSTFLTKHQSLEGYATTTALNNGLAGKQDKITNSNKLAYSLISGTPTSLPASDVAAWAKAASKPSYAFSEITNKPTTLGGYGITDAYTATTIDGKLSGYLPLSGGTIEDSIGGAFSVNRINGVEAYIKLLGRGVLKGAITAGKDTYGVALYNAVNGYYLGITNDGNPYYLGASRYTLIHSGNIGSQSVEYATSAGSATKLQTSRTIWGQSFDGTGDVSGYLNNVNYIKSNATNGYFVGNRTDGLSGVTDGGLLLWSYGNTPISFYTNASSRMKITGEGNILIGTTTDKGSKLYVNGDVRFDGQTMISGSMRFYGKTNLSSDMYINNQSVGGLNFAWSDGVSRFFIGYNVGIGTTNPEYKLDVVGAARCQYMLFYGTDGTTQAGYIGRGATTNNDIYILSSGALHLGTNNGDSKVIINTSGNVGIGTSSPTERLHVVGNIVATGSVTAKSSSDYRLKCEFDYGVDYQERLLSLGKVCDFNYTPHAQEREFAFADDKRHTSVIWQDARKANITGFCSVEEDGYGTVNPLSSDLIFTMVGAIQQGITKTEKIEERVVRLEMENEALRKEINDMKGGRYGC